MLAAEALLPLSLGALPTQTFPILPAYKEVEGCADDASWSYRGKYGETTCADWYGFHCTEPVAQHCGETAEQLQGVIDNCQETCDLCEKGINVHGDPMFRAGDMYTKLVMPEGKLQPLLAWNTSDGARCVLHGATISAGNDDEAEKDAQWFTHFRIEVNGTTVMDVSRVVPDIAHGQLASKMRVALDQKEIPVALPGVTAPEQHNSASRVVGLKLGTMGKRTIGMHRAERLVLTAGGMAMEITSAAARKFKSARLQVKFAHFNLHIDKLPAGARGLIAELKGMQPLSNKSMSYLRQEPRFHVDASKKVELRQKSRAEKRNEYEGLCPGQNSLPPAPPYPPMNLAPLAELDSYTLLPKWCDETGSHSGGTPIMPSSDLSHEQLVEAGIEFCEQAPNDYTCRQCCDFGASGPKSICSSGNRCPGENNNDMWKAYEGCAATIGVTFSHIEEGTDTEICVQSSPVSSGCIRAFNVLEGALEEEEENECLSMIDADTLVDLTDSELEAFSAKYPEGIKEAILASRQGLEDAVETLSAEGTTEVPQSLADPEKRVAGSMFQKVADPKAKKIEALREAMRTVDKDMHSHHAWQALVSLAKKRRNLPNDYKKDTLDVQVKSRFGKASLADVGAVRALLAQVALGHDDDEVKFCVNVEAVKFLIEEVAHLVDVCIKPSGYQCAPLSFCDSEACGTTPSRVLLKACMASQTTRKFERAAFVQHGPGRNASLNGCEAAEYALKAYNLPENAHPEDYLTLLRASSTVVNREPIVKGLRSMLQARKESRKSVKDKRQ